MQIFGVSRLDYDPQGDAGGACRGTNIIKNTPTFKIEHWSIIGL